MSDETGTQKTERKKDQTIPEYHRKTYLIPDSSKKDE